MAYRIEIKRSARKQLLALGRRDQGGVMAAIADLARVPRPEGARKIVGTENAFRIRVGDYRVVYTIVDRVLTVYIIRVAHRKDVYRGL